MRATPEPRIVFRLYRDCIEMWTARDVVYLLELLDCFPEHKSLFVQRGLEVARSRLTGQTFKEIGARFRVGPCRARQYLEMGHHRARRFLQDVRGGSAGVR